MFESIRRGISHIALRTAAAFGASFNTASPPPTWILQAFGLSGPGGAQVITERSALMLPPVWSANRLIANSLSKCVPGVYKRTGDVVELQADHPVSMLFQEPNTLGGIGMPGLLKTSQTHYNIAGQAFQQIERDETGTPVRIWPLPESTQPLIPVDTQRGIVGYRTQIGGTSVDLPPGDVIHARDISLDGWNAESPIRLCMRALQVGAQMEKFGLDFYVNDTTTGGILVHPGRLTDTAKGNIRKSWKEQARGDGQPSAPNVATVGTDHFNIKVLEEGMKFIQTTTNPEQAQFLSGREFFNSEVARIWNVPLVLLNSAEGSSVWGTGIEKLINEFVNQTITPIVIQWADEYSRKLLTPEERAAGLFVQFDVSSLLRGDPKERAETFKIMYDSNALTPNEWRAAEGRNPIDGGDELSSAAKERLKPEPPPAPGSKAPPTDEGNPK